MYEIIYPILQPGNLKYRLKKCQNKTVVLYPNQKVIC